MTSILDTRLDEPVHELSARFSQILLEQPPQTPIKPKKRPGIRSQRIAAAPRWVPPPPATPSRARRDRAVAFKLGVLSWAYHTKVDDGRGGVRKPTREEIRQKFGLKQHNQISKWRKNEALLLQAYAKAKRIRRSAPRWKALEKALTDAFTQKRSAGQIVRHRWFERTAKQLFKEIYPHSVVEFKFSQGWFSRFLSRHQITLRSITNKAQETPEEYREMIINFLCFNRRNSQPLLPTSLTLTIPTAPTVPAISTVPMVGRYLLSHILNMDQTPLPWEYLDRKTYEFRGKKTVWVKGTKSGWGKRQATIQLTIFADGSNRVKPLLIYRGAAGKESASRKREIARYDPRVVVQFNPKAYANTATTTF